ncbi:unnamed protein product [Closterium sp. NIES-54]
MTIVMKASLDIDPPHRKIMSRSPRQQLIYAIPFSQGFISTVPAVPPFAACSPPFADGVPPSALPASHLLVSGLPKSLPPLPPSHAPPCLPCIEGRQRVAPHSSSFPSTIAPLQTLHMDVWGPARLSGQGRERYFLLVVDDYTPSPAPRAVPRGPSCPASAFDEGGEFSSDLLQDFCHAEGILLSFMLPASPHKNGVAEHRIGLVMEVARTSMIHAVAPHFQWHFAVRYAAHQLNLWPHVSLPETSPTLRWTGKVGDASVFRVWGSRAFVRNSSADKLSSRALPCVFLGLPPYLAPCPPLLRHHV